MMRLMRKAVALTFVLNLFSPVVVRAADYATTASSATTVTNTTPHRHHHRLKNTTSASATSSNTGAPASNTDAPGMSDSLGTNNPGSPNMGSSDHSPGTTGTSGQ